MIEKLEAVAEGRIKRLMVFMPPGSAKSHYANVNFTPYYLGRNPDRTIITASYGQELADKWGRRSRNIVASPEFRSVFGFGVSADSAAANRWATERGGEYLAVGVGGPVTGNRADGGIIDDPVKSREEAESETVRNRVKDWYRDDFWTRLKPGAWVVLIMTRWHEDDLAGWLLEEAKHGGEQWEVVSLPAIAEENDPLGRAPGEHLWPEWFRPEMFAEARRDMRRWSALYQQRPSPETGSYFLRDWLRWYESPPVRETVKIYGASDYAVTADGGDYTVHGIIGLDPRDNIYVLDWWRSQASSDQWVDAFCDMVKRWKPLAWAEENGQISKGVGPFLEKRMRERQAYCYREQYTSAVDKPTRAQSIRGRMAMGMVYFPRQAEWSEELVRQLLSFPTGRHDDDVDVLSLFGRMLDRLIKGKELPDPIGTIRGANEMTLDEVWKLRGPRRMGARI